MQNIFCYNDPSRFLQDIWREKKATNPSFSLRSWAKRLGFQNSSPLSMILNGRRAVPKKYLPAIVRHLALSKTEGLYLEAMIDCQTAKSTEARQYYRERLNSLVPRPPLSMTEIEHFKLIENPIHMAILEMTDLHGFRRNSRWIQRRLRIKCSVNDVEHALSRLMQLGLLHQDGLTLRKSQQHLATPADVHDQAVTQYHRNVAKLAAAEVEMQTVDQREFNSFALNINPKDLQKAKSLIRRFVDEFIEQVEAKPKEGLETYQFAVQLFSLTQGKAK